MTRSDRPSVPPAQGTRLLPARPSLEHLKKQAKELLSSLQDKQPEAKLSDGQFELAKSYGFTSWRAMKAYVDALLTKPAHDADGFGQLGFVAFPVADLARSQHFYESLLGASILTQTQSEHAFDLRLGGLRIKAYIHHGEYRRQHSGLQFFVTDLDQKVSEWRDAGVRFSGDLRDEP
ncbi:MAG: VOC family protein, partial [Phycisphaeraceae bacterium]